MVTFYSISSLRENVIKYCKQDSYKDCRSDLCDFFKDKSIDDIFSRPILVAPNDFFRYIKSRIPNSNFGAGKSGGYRIYYYVDIRTKSVFLAGFYPKTGKYGIDDLSPTEEKQMINLFSKERKDGKLIKHNIDKEFEEIEEKKITVK